MPFSGTGGGSPVRPRIILIEDNPSDVMLFREAFHLAELDLEIVEIPDGAAALAYITETQSGQKAPPPDLVILDINLPKHNGIEVLQRLRSYSELAELPVIAVSSSSSPADKAQIEALGIEVFFEKPSDLDNYWEFGKVVGSVLGAFAAERRSGQREGRT